MPTRTSRKPAYVHAGSFHLSTAISVEFMQLPSTRLSSISCMTSSIPGPFCSNFFQTRNDWTVNYSEARYRHAIDGMKEIHKALVHHRDIYPKNILIVPGEPDRVVWIDFDVASTFTGMGLREQAYCRYEDELVASFGEVSDCLAYSCLNARTDCLDI